MDLSREALTLLERLQKQIHDPSEAAGGGYVAPMVIKSTETLNKSGSAGLRIMGYTSTDRLDRHRDVVKPQAFAKYLNDYLNKNPVVLFQHNHDAPIGVAEKVELKPDGVYVEDVIFNETAAQKEATTLINQGIVRSLSVGGIVHKSHYFNIEGMDPDDWRSEGREIDEMELVEHSVVTIPANIDSVFYAATQKRLTSSSFTQKAGRAISNKNRQLLERVAADMEAMLVSMGAAHTSIKGLLDATSGAKEEETEEVASAFNPEVLEQLRRIDSLLQ